MINLSNSISSHFTEKLLVKSEEGEYINGFWIEAESTELYIYAIVSVTNKEDLVDGVEGENTKDVRSFLSKSKLKISDVINYNSKDYKIISQQNNKSLGFYNSVGIYET